MYKSLLVILFSYTLVFSQSYEFYSSIGKFNNAGSLYITANGIICVSDFGKDEIVMLDTLGNNLKSFGGYGWDENSFDDPSDVFADPLTIYVADKNNHSIKRFDKNLNYVSSLYKRESENAEEQFGYPISCATSNMGDLYIIDSENYRIMKFDIFGNYVFSFGGLDAGVFQLENPLQLAISSANIIYVIDGSDIVIFDQYGNGISRFSLNTKIKSVRILFDKLVVCTEEGIYYSDLRSHESKLNKIIVESLELKKIVSALLFNNKLYILLNESILVFTKIN
jgi:hypothetical protein